MNESKLATSPGPGYSVIPTPERVTYGNGHWLVWVAVPLGVQWNWRGIPGACEPKDLGLVVVPKENQ